MKLMLSYLWLTLKKESMDDAVARLLRKVTKPVLLAVNKVTMQCVRKMRLSSII
jgi:predicted GTPase